MRLDCGAELSMESSLHSASFSGRFSVGFLLRGLLSPHGGKDHEFKVLMLRETLVIDWERPPFSHTMNSDGFCVVVFHCRVARSWGEGASLGLTLHLVLKDLQDLRRPAPHPPRADGGEIGFWGRGREGRGEACRLLSVPLPVPAPELGAGVATLWDEEPNRWPGIFVFGHSH